MWWSNKEASRLFVHSRLINHTDGIRQVIGRLTSASSIAIHKVNQECSVRVT